MVKLLSKLGMKTTPMPAQKIGVDLSKRKANSQTPANASWALPSVLLFIAFCSAAVIIYAPSFHGEFIWDDVRIYIVENALLSQPNAVYRFWFTNDPIDYYPLTYTTFWMEYQFVGAHPELYHIDNWLLHAASTLAVYWSMRELRVPGAIWLACLFLVHPIQVESVAWICQRKTILSTGLGFASIAAYLRYARNGDSGWLVGSIFLFMFSLSARPTMIMLPVGLVAYLFVERKKPG